MWLLRVAERLSCIALKEQDSVHAGQNVSWAVTGMSTLSSSKVKPRPKRFFMLYLTVCPLTTGLNAPAAGLGNTFLAFSTRAARQRQQRRVKLLCIHLLLACLL